jgi:hypothetical protein
MVTRFEDTGSDGVIVSDGALISTVFLPPLIVITPSLLACAEAARFVNTSIPRQISTPDSLLFVIVPPDP